LQKKSKNQIQLLQKGLKSICKIHHSSFIMETIQKIGIALFALGLAIFLLSPALSEFELTPAIVQKVVQKPYHLNAISDAARPLFYKTYSNNVAFISDLNTALSAAKSRQDQKAKVENWKATALPEGVSEWDFRIGDLNSIRFELVKASSKGFLTAHTPLMLLLSFGFGIVGALLYILPKRNKPAGIQNNGIFHSPMHARGWLGILTGSFLIAFYIFLYWFPEYLTSWVQIVEPLSRRLSGNGASQWFLYGVLYTICVVVMGVRMLLKYRHNRYQQIRTLSVMFFQTTFAFLIPEILVRLNQPYFDFKNMWPLKYDFFFEWHLDKLLKNGTLGVFMLVWGMALFLIGVPVFTYFFGKRWYCSWVCGCGGLAETLGDPYRQLSDKSLKAWKLERYLVHGVLVFAVLMTLLVLYTYFTGATNILFISSYDIRALYGFLIGSAFAGVVGTGFYPLMGNRVWCRFGCPLAAYLGLVQKYKSRFRITVNGGQCISCGNCSTYCEMGIDVRSYAQKGQDIIRSSCVGCGVCAAVCPRGVLRLENGDDVHQRAQNERVIHIGLDDVRILN
jgi:ferredoxin-type protein NapH